MAFFGKAQELVERAWEGNPHQPTRSSVPVAVVKTMTDPVTWPAPPPQMVKPVAVPVETKNLDDLTEYRELLKVTGVRSVDLEIEEFKAFLSKHDIPVFSMPVVAEYMTAMAAKDGKKWQWVGLREKDHALFDGGVYSKVVPISALKKVALIEKHKFEVAFAVSDYYVPNPDPFLLVALRNIPWSHAPSGFFVIDFWDEPGFGIDKMIAK